MPTEFFPVIRRVPYVNNVQIGQAHLDRAIRFVLPILNASPYTRRYGSAATASYRALKLLTTNQKIDTQTLIKELLLTCCPLAISYLKPNWEIEAIACLQVLRFFEAAPKDRNMAMALACSYLLSVAAKHYNRMSLAAASWTMGVGLELYSAFQESDRPEQARDLLLAAIRIYNSRSQIAYALSVCISFARNKPSQYSGTEFLASRTQQSGKDKETEEERKERIRKLREKAKRLRKESLQHSENAYRNAFDFKPGSAMVEAWKANKKERESVKKSWKADRVENEKE